MADHDHARVNHPQFLSAQVLILVAQVFDHIVFDKRLAVDVKAACGVIVQIAVQRCGLQLFHLGEDYHHIAVYLLLQFQRLFFFHGNIAGG